ncbi:hypothetical protein AC578_3517 [Pseudocercospora eumusae]|uniref:Uncharacterized protein n=1 Tax=Pseudocercospora eumusae TaxID=321146 RepID=A0A139H9J5_9PEZI|nr:hypothetical protein AC578_3517 [Pseudocercospora eumusae]
MEHPIAPRSTASLARSLQQLLRNLECYVQNDKPNGGFMRGYNIFLKTLHPPLNIREDAACAYYLPIKVRANLELYLNAFAERLTWSDDRFDAQPFANGVVFTSESGQKQQLSAKREIVLSVDPVLSRHHPHSVSERICSSSDQP